MRRVTVTLDDDLMAEIDRLVEVRGYQNRSEAVRDLARAGLAEMAHQAGSQQDCVGVLSYVYDHAAYNLAGRLTDAFHRHHDLTVASMHVHLDAENCLEVGILRGPMATLQHFADRLTSERAVHHGSLHVVPTPARGGEGGHDHHHHHHHHHHHGE